MSEDFRFQICPEVLLTYFLVVRLPNRVVSELRIGGIVSVAGGAFGLHE